MSALGQEEAQARPRRVQAGERRAGRRLPGLEPGRVEAGDGGEPLLARRGGTDRSPGATVARRKMAKRRLRKEMLQLHP